jgi:iron complex outermembrane receptor protein
MRNVIFPFARLRRSVFSKTIASLLAGAFSSACLATHADVLTEDDVFGDIPVVSGVSHFPQKLSDAPASVTIIDRKMIDASGAVEIIDLFRMVPGFQVYFPHYGRQAINYHGFPQEDSYRMEIKLDGRSVYEPAENSVLWPTLPIELDDIDYIEVVRGANAPADGANATIAAVNIITKTPVASKGWRVRAVAGDWDTHATSAAYSGSEENFSYKINGGHRYTSGFPNSNGNVFDDDVESSYVSIRSMITPSLYDTVDIQLGYSDNNIDMADSGRGIDIDGIVKWDYENYYLSSSWERQLANQDSFELLFYYNYADIDAPESLGLYSDIFSAVFPEYDSISDKFPGLNDFEVIFGLYDSYSERSDIEFRYTANVSNSIRSTVGIATRYDRMKSARQFVDAVDVEESSQRLFANLEAKLSEDWTLNAGSIVEYNRMVHAYSSYRLSANYHFNANHTVRLAFNDGERSPGLYEGNQQGGVVESGYILDIDTVAPDNLDTEKFESQEISYYATLLEQTLTLDLKLFREKSSDLIKYMIEGTEEYFGYSDNFDNRFTLRTNTAWVDSDGIETQIKYQPDEHWLLNFQYSYSDHSGRWLRRTYDYVIPQYRDWDEIAPAEMASLTAAYFFDSGFEASLLWYYQDEVEWEEGHFSDDHQRVDLRLAQRFKTADRELLVELIGQNIFDEEYVEFHDINEYKSRYLLRATMGF